MARSMTGFGAARTASGSSPQGTLEVSAEVRSVNGRYLKLTTKLPASLAAREHEIEALVRTRVRRGSVTLRVSIRETRPEALVSINEEVVRAYQTVFRRLGISEAPLATLPGVLGGEVSEMSDEQFAVVATTVERALEALVAMRDQEGKALEQVLSAELDAIVRLAAAARLRAPVVVAEHQAKLSARIGVLVKDFGTGPFDAQLVAREVALMADRSDVTEELDRIASHVAQARALLRDRDEAGRKLEFVAQELLREINTLGSKSADAELTRTVIELKSELERFREQIANIE